MTEDEALFECRVLESVYTDGKGISAIRAAAEAAKIVVNIGIPEMCATAAVLHAGNLGDDVIELTVNGAPYLKGFWSRLCVE
ncbi:hypothetical protein BN1723_010988 [Verticillium longisporum]|uniref:Uncharacterized protein n=1 Tax=Verticillium longisporum TaxID=100787 RepID=A0A0G4MYZ3_VERLO|nr:hypothetical protein BN1723_010988 [Verticillium longisporum]CRK39334.1 hypothetical protein BN1708_001581 [Verticillium longisporum]